MIIGDPSILAIESKITHGYERISLRALGLFVLHIGGRRYGVYKPDATMLACSFDEVERRIAGRGGHTAPFAAELDAGSIANALCNAVYADAQDESYFGIPLADFCDLVHSNYIIWTPDGDSAFDDGSNVLQFDIQDRVRLIGFECGGQACLHDPTTLSDVWLAADDFYFVLQQWHDAFESEWAFMPKVLDD